MDDKAAQGAGNTLISGRGGTTNKPRQVKERPSAHTFAAKRAAKEVRESKRNESVATFIIY